MKFNQSPTFNRLKDLVKQFIKFGLVGVSNTLISIVIYNGLLYIKINYIVAYTIAFLISVVNAYFWNKKYVFNKQISTDKKPFIKVFLSYGSTFLLGMLLLFILVSYLGISEQLAQILILFITIPLNFLLNKLWAFK